MGTLFIYVVVITVVGGLLFIVAAALFGRSEELEPLPRGVSPTVLPAADVRGDDIRAVRFRLRLRGYDQHDVDWTLARLADRLDELNARIVALESGAPAQGWSAIGPTRVLPPSRSEEGASTAVRESPSEPVETVSPDPADPHPGVDEPRG